MLDLVVASSFIERTKTGRNSPFLLEAIHLATGETVEVYAKFSRACECGETSLVNEAISAMLGVDLGLPVPEPFLVQIDSDFIDSFQDENLKRILAQGAPVGFGSKKLPSGFRQWLSGEIVPDGLLEVAAGVVLFDGVLQNFDRKPSNPNSQRNDHQVAIFDHDLALMVEGLLHFVPPWRESGLSGLLSSQGHLFFRSLKGKAIDMTNHLAKWKSLSNSRLVQYRDALPAEWSGSSDHVTAIFDYLNDAIINIDDVVAEVERRLR